MHCWLIRHNHLGTARDCSGATGSLLVLPAARSAETEERWRARRVTAPSWAAAGSAAAITTLPEQLRRSLTRDKGARGYSTGTPLGTGLQVCVSANSLLQI